MPMNLTKAPDHPATVLEAKADDYARHNNLDSMAVVEEALRENAAPALREYEETHEVTFAALSNDALAAVREAYAAYQAPCSGPSAVAIEHNRLIGLARAIADLLGLDDENEG